MSHNNLYYNSGDNVVEEFTKNKERKYSFSDLMKFTAVNESLSKQSRNDQFQRKTNWINS